MNRTLSVGIRGAGLAGVTCARRVLERFPEALVTIFDVRPRLPHPQRTFCFFDDGEIALSAVPARRWSTVRCRGARIDRSINCAGSPYTCIRGDDFFSTEIAWLEARSVEFRWGCAAVELESGALTAEGERRLFDVVIDAACEPSEFAPLLWQSFGGIVIEAEHPVFNSSEALLMDLLPSTAESPIQFVYVLPFSPTEALVEHTTFSFSRRPQEEHRAGCRAWLDRAGISAYREQSYEVGAIPMGLPRSAARPWPVVGTTAGGVRSGTGYGFTAIHRQVGRLAHDFEAVLSRQPWRYDPTSWVLRVGDSLFLRALQRSPIDGRDILEGLFERAADEDITAFLSGRAGAVQAVRIMSGVPKVRMARALCGWGSDALSPRPGFQVRRE